MRAAVLVLVGLVVGPLRAWAGPVELTVHVARDADGAPVADDTWIDDAIATAGDRLGPAGASFHRTDGSGDGVPAHVADTATRDGLASLAADDGTVHVFVVARLDDVDADAEINGVTWRGGGRRYLIVSRGHARGDTLAHELGHFFGLHHTTAPDNLMTSPDRTDTASLDAAQLRTVRRHLAAWGHRTRK